MLLPSRVDIGDYIVLYFLVLGVLSSYRYT